MTKTIENVFENPNYKSKMTPESAYKSALKSRRRMPDLEPIILTSAEYSFFYAQNIIGGAWQEAEPIILSDVRYARYYTDYIIGKKNEIILQRKMRKLDKSNSKKDNLIEDATSDAPTATSAKKQQSYIFEPLEYDRIAICLI